MSQPNQLPLHLIPLGITCDVLDRLGIVDIHETGGHFQRLVVAKILATGRHVDDLTVREVRALIAEASEEFQRVAA